MINFSEQVKFDQDKLDVMDWHERGHFVLNKVNYYNNYSY